MIETYAGVVVLVIFVNVANRKLYRVRHRL